MADYTSEIKTVHYNVNDVYNVLSDMSNLEMVKDKIPQDKIKDFNFDKDSCAFTVDPIGKIKFAIIERNPATSIKFEAQQIPFGVNLIICLEPISDSITQMKLKVQADLNPFLKPMVSKPLQDGLEKMANALSTLPYGDILNQTTI